MPKEEPPKTGTAVEEKRTTPFGRRGGRHKKTDEKIRDGDPRQAEGVASRPGARGRAGVLAEHKAWASEATSRAANAGRRLLAWLRCWAVRRRPSLARRCCSWCVWESVAMLASKKMTWSVETAGGSREGAAHIGVGCRPLGRARQSRQEQATSPGEQEGAEPLRRPVPSSCCRYLHPTSIASYWPAMAGAIHQQRGALARPELNNQIGRVDVQERICEQPSARAAGRRETPKAARCRKTTTCRRSRCTSRPRRNSECDSQRPSPSLNPPFGCW